ncbi:MAG: GAF domain-containing protein, partial [Anaerolineae bacterium]|nr:GAF domain-containing protein [Anaerolineae bacterium]
PHTRSEGALPLRSRGQVIGALSVQSAKPAVFDDETVAVLQLMADQVAVALDNARLFTESRAAAEAARRAYGELSRRAWEELLRSRPSAGYQADALGITRLEDTSPQSWDETTQMAWQTGQLVKGEPTEAVGGYPLAIPVQVRGTVVGILDAVKPLEAGKWTQEELLQVQTLAEQVGIALDNARLYEDSRRRAGREQLITDITARVRSSMDIETIMQTAIRELGMALGTDRTFIQLVGLPAEAKENRDVQEVDG